MRFENGWYLESRNHVEKMFAESSDCERAKERMLFVVFGSPMARSCSWLTEFFSFARFRDLVPL